MNDRKRLPNRRQSMHFEFKWMNKTYQCGVSDGVDGGLGEVFINVGPPGSDLDAATRDLAVVTSIALQHGCDVKTIRNALTMRETGPAGPLGAFFDRLDELCK